MRPKPNHLRPAYAAQFADRSVAAAYRHRPPYPAATFDLLAEPASRGLFVEHGERRTAPVPFAQPVAADVASFHARNGFSRERMGAARAAAFDAAVASSVRAFCPHDRVGLSVAGVVVGGRPAPG